MAKSIFKLTPGQNVLLRFEYKRGEDYTEAHIFQGVKSNPVASGGKVAMFLDAREGFEWAVYRYKGRWAYGTGAQRVSIASIGTDADDAVLDAWTASREEAEES